MVLPTEDVDEADEDLDIFFLLSAQGHAFFPLLYSFTAQGYSMNDFPNPL
jgi:hypothetical protein